MLRRPQEIEQALPGNLARGSSIRAPSSSRGASPPPGGLKRGVPGNATSGDLFPQNQKGSYSLKGGGQISSRGERKYLSSSGGSISIETSHY